MKIAKRLYSKAVRTAFDWMMGSGLRQDENVPEGQRYITPGMPELLRRCAGESIVLLKNEQNTLPLAKNDVVSVFGRCQYDWFYVGYGSGGDVHPPYSVSLMDGLKKNGIPFYQPLAKQYQQWRQKPENQADHGWWGHWPYFHEEMPLDSETVADTAKNSSVALVVIGRAAGEDRENVLEEGSYYLTAAERQMLKLVCQHFTKVVLIMNCGNIMDLSFIEEYPISAVLYAWQLGQESGNAVADVLSGKVNPCGKLADTIARKYEDYPSSAHFGNRDFNNYEEDIFVGYRFFETFRKERVLFPFGFGLSYTAFSLENMGISRRCEKTILKVKVTNTGTIPGKEVVQVYCEPARGKLSKARKNLVAFTKTALLAPGESQVVTLTVPDLNCGSFDDSGVTGFKDAFVLEAGTYRLLIGNCSTTQTEAFSFQVSENKLLQQCQEACGPETAFSVQANQGKQSVSTGKRNLRQRILRNLPDEIPYTGNQGIKLTDVSAGKHSLEAFVAQLSDKDLADLTKGEGGMGSALGTPGNAGAFGGVTPELRELGVPAIITADGPAGLRVRKYTSLLPCGTAIACTWDQALIEELFTKVGQEAAYFGIDVLLAPGMNIHRNPLCGRNFEYYSEDPLLCGKTAAAAVRGLQAGGTSACPKHFACNNQEVNRNYNDSRVSMRALREIYLKCFEICIKEGAPQNLMTSYNKINGVWSHYNYDLATTILREEWGYQGNVVTDWWMRKSASPEFPQLRDNAYRVRAQVDVLMPGNMDRVTKGYRFDKKQLETLGQPDGLTRAELQRSAMNVLKFALTRIK